MKSLERIHQLDLNCMDVILDDFKLGSSRIEGFPLVRILIDIVQGMRKVTGSPS